MLSTAEIVSPLLTWSHRWTISLSIGRHRGWRWRDSSATLRRDRAAMPGIEVRTARVHSDLRGRVESTEENVNIGGGWKYISFSQPNEMDQIRFDFHQKGHESDSSNDRALSMFRGSWCFLLVNLSRLVPLASLGSISV